MRDPLEPFDALYRASADPWGTTTRWYERRKRDLLLASLPCARYATAYEAGCGTGHISVALADRCDALLASDGSTDALVVAARAVAGCRNVTLAHHRLPDDWPAGAFDLIVLSELLYFLKPVDIDRTALAARHAAATHGTVIACNWRHAIDGHGHRGDAVHRRFADTLALPRSFEYADDDFVLTGWSADAASVAQRDGVRP